MYRLLIVDDEPIIVEGLFDFFSELEELELQVFKAYSGVEALEIMKKGRVDIVLSDICMPGITGLQLQKEIILQWPKCKIIFLTGFNDFEYVRTAIRNGGVDYILKTEGDEAILNAVKKCIEQIEQELQDEYLLMEAHRKLDLALPVLRKKYVLDILEGMEEFEEKSNQLSNFDIPLKADRPILLLAGRIDKWKDDILIKDKHKILYQVSEIMEDCISVTANILTLVYDNFNLVWLVQAKEADDALWNRTIIYIHGVIDSVQERIKSMLGLTTSFIVSGEKVSWNEAATKFSYLKYCFNKSAALSKGVLIVNFEEQARSVKSKNIEDQEKEFGIRSELKKIPTLEAFLESSQRDEFNKLYNNITNSIKKKSPLSVEIKTEIYYSFAVMFISVINKISLTENEKEEINTQYLLQMNSHNSWDSVFDYFYNLSQHIFNKKQMEYSDNANRIIAYIKNYTENNLSGDLSLTKLADLLHFNHSYLSRLYKQSTGVSLSDYISEVKVNKARELLRKDNIKINEISTALGFETPSYFTRFFKKHTNLTPQEYRESLLR